MYKRTLANEINSRVGKRKAIILTGPRQVGKTTLVKTMLNDSDFLFFDADDPTVRQLLDSPNTEQLRNIIGHHTTIFIDEAQRIPNIGLTIKLIVDQIKDVQVFVSGSSSFELNNELNEPLTGRKWEYELLPISWEEFENKHGYLKAEQQLENRLIYGFYPDVLNNPGEEKEILRQLVSSYLFRDILSFSKIRKSEVLEKLVLALALQVGSEVNNTELAQTVGVDKNTINSYIELLQKGYVIFKLGSYSKNIRNEIKKNSKIYFFDNGIRNMIIGNFNQLDLRNDTGALWENFLISERFKQNIYKSRFSKSYFWRTKQQQEIDFIEENNQTLTAYEFKWNAKQKARIPKTFSQAYKADEFIIDRSNFRDFVIKTNNT